MRCLKDSGKGDENRDVLAEEVKIKGQIMVPEGHKYAVQPDKGGEEGGNALSGLAPLSFQINVDLFLIQGNIGLIVFCQKKNFVIQGAG